MRSLTTTRRFHLREHVVKNLLDGGHTPHIVERIILNRASAAYKRPMRETVSGETDSKTTPAVRSASQAPVIRRTSGKYKR